MSACVTRTISVASSQQSVGAQKCSIIRVIVKDDRGPGGVATTVGQEKTVLPGWCSSTHWHRMQSRIPNWLIKSGRRKERDYGKSYLGLGLALYLFYSRSFHASSGSLDDNWKVQVLVTQSCPTLCNPMDYNTLQAPLFTEFSRWDYWSGLPFPSPDDLPNPGIEPGSPALQADSLPSEPPGKPRR